MINFVAGDFCNPSITQPPQEMKDDGRKKPTMQESFTTATAHPLLAYDGIPNVHVQVCL